MNAAVKSLLLAALIGTAPGGCATRNHLAAFMVLPDDGNNPAAYSRAERAIQTVFPAQYRATQRAIITAGGKQFTCDGLLTVSPVEGHHLALVSSFGTVTDLRVKADGVTELLKVTPLFREDWSRDFVARDLRRLFVPPANLQPAGRLADGRLELKTVPDSAGVVAEYIFLADGSRWEELDLARDGKIFYRALAKRYRTLTGTASEMPSEFEVSAESYRLELHIAAFKSEAQP